MIRSFAATGCLAAAVAAQAAEPLQRAGEHFAVRLHPGALSAPLAGQLADASLAAAESAWPTIGKLLGAKNPTPPVLHVYADEPAYRALEREHAPGFERPSFARLAEQAAHVLLWPGLSAQALAIVGLPDSTRQQLIGCAAQLVAAQHARIAVEEPWLAEVFAYAVRESIVHPKRAFGREPDFDSRRLLLHHDLAQGKLRELRGSYMDFSTPTTKQQFDAQEESKCLMAQMMADSGKGWAKKLLPSSCKDEGKPRAIVRTNAVERVLGTNWTKIESHFSELCMKVAPVWRAAGPMAAATDGGMLVVGTQDTPASFSALAPPPGDRYAILAKCKLAPCASDSFRIQLDWNEASMIGCFFGVGAVSVERWEVGTSSWTPLAKGKAPIVAGQPFELAVEVGPTVRLSVDGHEYAQWDRGDRTMQGLWSVGVNDCVVWIDGLRIERRKQ